jgi:hypothetical protein
MIPDDFLQDCRKLSVIMELAGRAAGAGRAAPGGMRCAARRGRRGAGGGAAA